MKKIIRFFTILLASLFSFHSVSAQKKMYKSLIFHIESLRTKNDSVYAKLDIPFNIGIEIRASATAYLRFKPKSDSSKEVNFTNVGSGRIIETGKNVIAFIKLNNPSKTLAKGDLVEISVPVPNLTDRGVVSDLAFSDIFLADNNKIPFYTLQSIWQKDDKIYQDSLYKEFKYALQEIYDLIKDDQQGKDLDSTFTTGNYKGSSVLKMLYDPKREDMESFLYFIYSFPGKYIGTIYKFSETYATWLINNAPKGHMEVINKLMPIYKNKSEFLARIKKYEYDIVKQGHIESIVGEAMTAFELNKKEEATGYNEFAKALAYHVNDQEGKAWYWLFKAEMLHKNDDFQNAIPFVDSSFHYAQKSGNNELILNAKSKKLYCLVYSRQFTAAIKVAKELTLLLEQLKPNLSAAIYSKNLLKLYEYEGNAYYKNGEYGKALEFFNKIVEENISKNTYESLERNGYFYKFIGQVNNDQGLVEEALTNFFKSEKIYQANADTFQLGYVQSEIAYSYNIKGDYKTSIEYTAKARANSLAVNDDVNIGYTYSVDGSNYWKQGDYNAAERAHKSSIEYRGKTGRVALQGDAWSKLGALYLESGSKKLALSAYDSAIAKYEKVKDNNSIADIYNKQGELHAKDENYKLAVEYFEKANGVSTKSTADALYNLGEASSSIDSTKSRMYLEKCIQSCKETKNLGLEYNATYMLASSAYTNSNFSLGDKHYMSCVRLAKELKNDFYNAACLVLEGRKYVMQSELDNALSSYRKAISYYDTLSKSSVINQLQNIASIQTSKGDFNAAIGTYKEAIRISEEIDNRIGLAESLSASSFVYGQMGEFEDGLKNNDTAFKIFNESGYFLRVAGTKYNRGTLLISQGRQKDAIKEFMAADSIYSAQNIQDSRTSIFTAIGIIYFRQGDYANAYKNHSQALRLLPKNVVDETYLLTATNVAEILVYQKKNAEAEKELLRLIPIAKAKKINRILTGMYASLGKSYFDTKKYDLAKDNYHEAYNLGKVSSDQEAVIDALIYLGKAEIELKNYQKAEAHFVEAAELNSKYNIASGWESFYQLGLFQYNQKKYEVAIQNFKKATAQLDKNTENLYGGEAAAKIYNNDPRKSDLYEKLTFAYYNTGNIAEAWNYANRSNIAGIKELAGSLGTSTNDVEKNEALKKLLALQQQKKQLEETAAKQDGEAKVATLKQIEIQENKYTTFLEDVIQQFPDLGMYFTSSNANEFNNYKGKLPKDVAVLLYLQNNNTLMIFSLTNEKLAIDTMTIDVNQKIEDIIATIKNTGRTTGTGALSLRSDPLDEEEPQAAGDFKKQSSELYNILISSVYEKIKGKEKLCIIPSGIFSNLPFQCLGKTGANNKFEFLLQEFNVFYTNKMSIFNHPPTVINNALNMKSFAAFGVPDPTLTYNLKEVKEIGKILNASDDIYADKSATESAAKLSLQNKKYINFATHGVLNYSNFNQSYLKLLPDSDTTTGNNGRLTMTEIKELGIRDCDLVILSACQTAVSKQLVKGWNISPANSFLVSNVKTVVASLWKVADEPTGLLMEYFYANLANDASITKLDALRKAQIKLSQNPKFAHPNYWGAFVLYGGWE